MTGTPQTEPADREQEIRDELYQHIGRGVDELDPAEQNELLGDIYRSFSTLADLRANFTIDRELKILREAHADLGDILHGEGGDQARDFYALGPFGGHYADDTVIDCTDMVGLLAEATREGAAVHDGWLKIFHELVDEKGHGTVEAMILFAQGRSGGTYSTTTFQREIVDPCRGSWANLGEWAKDRESDHVSEYDIPGGKFGYDRYQNYVKWTSYAIHLLKTEDYEAFYCGGNWIIFQA